MQNSLCTVFLAYTLAFTFNVVNSEKEKKKNYCLVDFKWDADNILVLSSSFFFFLKMFLFLCVWAVIVPCEYVSRNAVNHATCSFSALLIVHVSRTATIVRACTRFSSKVFFCTALHCTQHSRIKPHRQITLILTLQQCALQSTLSLPSKIELCQVLPTTSTRT